MSVNCVPEVNDASEMTPLEFYEKLKSSSAAYPIHTQAQRPPYPRQRAHLTVVPHREYIESTKSHRERTQIIFYTQTAIITAYVVAGVATVASIAIAGSAVSSTAVGGTLVSAGEALSKTQVGQIAINSVPVQMTTSTRQHN